MKLKTLITMALLSVSALGSCQTGGNSNVTELTKEQKEYLKKLHRMYEFNLIGHRIAEGAEVEERTESLPWEDITVEKFDIDAVIDWLNNAQLDLKESYDLDGMLALRGSYKSDENWNVTQEGLRDSYFSNPYRQILGPIKKLGKIRIRLLSQFQNTNDNTLELGKFYHLSTSQNDKELSLAFYIKNPNSTNIKGGIEVELLPPLRWKHACIPLQYEGKEYEFDDVKFKLFKSEPGNVILEYDKKYGNQMAKLRIIPIKQQKPMKTEMVYRIGGEAVLRYYQNPYMGFGEWCVMYKSINCDSLGITPETLESAIHLKYQPTEEELLHFNETMGEMIGIELADELTNADRTNFSELYREWIIKGYEAIRELKDDLDYLETMKDLHERYGNDRNIFIPLRSGAIIGSSYAKADLKPDWNVIERCATDLLDKNSNANSDSLRNEINKHKEEYIESLVMRREVLPFLTDEDIRQLSKPVKTNESPLMYSWYKTNTEADSIYIYWPDTLSNRPLLKVRYQLRKGKPELLFP